MKTKRNHSWQRTVLWTATGLLGLQLNAGDTSTWLGVSVGTVADAVRHQLQLPRGAGLTVESVADGSPAAKAGLEQHDVLQKVDDQWLFNADQLTRLIRSYEPGNAVDLTVLRGGRSESLVATLGEHEVMPGPSWSVGGPMMGFGGGGAMGGGAFGMGSMGGMGAPGGMGGGGFSTGVGPGAPGGMMGGMGGGMMGGGGSTQPQAPKLLQDLEEARKLGGVWTPSGQPTAYLGVELREPDETLLEQLDRSREDGGVLIEQVIDDSPAARAGLVKHDLITELDAKKVTEPRQFAEIIGRWKPGDCVALKLLREGKPVEVKVELGKREPADAQQLKQFRRQYMVAPKIEVNALPNQSGSVIIMKSPNTGAGDPFGEGGTSAGFGMGTMMGGATGNPTVQNVEIHTTARGTGTVQSRIGTVISRDPAGELAVRQEGDSRHVTVKDAEGNVLFEGEVNSDTDREKLSPEVRERLEKVEQLLQQNLDRPEAPPVERQLRVIHEDAQPGFIRVEEEEVLTPDTPTGV
ncbi:MAG: PDZ domain-containing protein [Verrucomicrobiales bacterium]|nr:PDZ domain-containing protein [Verrucomicrobiales bacterium]